MKRLVFDIDGTLCYTRTKDQSYADVEPLPGAIESLKRLKADGYYIILQTARHMWTHQSNEGKVLAHGGPILFDWLKKWDVPYDEVYFGKPHAAIFIDDKGHRHTDWQSTMKFIREFHGE